MTLLTGPCGPSAVYQRGHPLFASVAFQRAAAEADPLIWTPLWEPIVFLVGLLTELMLSGMGGSRLRSIIWASFWNLISFLVGFLMEFLFSGLGGCWARSSNLALL
jgi:hypothetical protein